MSVRGGFRADRAGAVILEGATLLTVSSFAALMGAVRRGVRSRAKAATAANVGSSRSHSILTFELRVQRAAGSRGFDDSSEGGITQSRLRLCLLVVLLLERRRTVCFYEFWRPTHRLRERCATESLESCVLEKSF